MHHSQIYQTRAWEEEKEERWNKNFCDETMKTSEVIKQSGCKNEKKEQFWKQVFWVFVGKSIYIKHFIILLCDNVSVLDSGLAGTFDATAYREVATPLVEKCNCTRHFNTLAAHLKSAAVLLVPRCATGVLLVGERLIHPLWVVPCWQCRAGCRTSAASPAGRRWWSGSEVCRGRSDPGQRRKSRE